MSEWTPDLLKEYFEALREGDMLAVTTAAEMLGLRLEQMNEFRDQIQTERTEFVRRDYIDQQIEAGMARWNATNERVDMVEKWQAKLIGGLVFATLIVPLITGLIVYLLTRSAIPIGR